MKGGKEEAGLLALEGLEIRRSSLILSEGWEFALAGEDIAVLAPKGSPEIGKFEGETSARGERTLLLGPLSGRNASALRSRLPWLRPRPLGLRTSAGMGDRLGLATPGHVRAVRAVGGSIAPIFAQQSIREMERTGRSPQRVMDDATWGAFAEGWDGDLGADADHLKTTANIDACLEAGYSFFTFDPGEHVDDAAEGIDPAGLREKFQGLPWDDLEDRPDDLKRRYLTKDFEFEGCCISFDERSLAVAAVKYGRAVAHAARMYRHLQKNACREFEVEVSVDETDSPTTHVQHVYIATELKRLGVEWVSLAPRYVGRFEKGVDYIGNVEAFERDFAVHAAIARALGPYKLSLHSGSDKFSIYPAAVHQSRGLVHLKTAGTSYLEALRTVAALDPALFREIYAFAREHYEEDRSSYHVSAELSRTPEPEEVDDAELTALLEGFDPREVLHVTFGSVLRKEGLRGRLLGLLRSHSEEYASNLKEHFVRHLEPFASGGERG